MEGLGISFADSSASDPPSSPPSPTPLHEPTHGFTSRQRSTTATSDDSFMESKLSEFDDWKKTVAEGLSRKNTIFPTIPSLPASPTKEPFPAFDPRGYTDETRHLKLRAKARALAARAAAHRPPDVNAHPALRPQSVRLREKRNAMVTEVPRCWRPDGALDDEPWSCCERAGSVCEDCGYVLCEACGSRCRGVQWCVVAGCVRCQTRLGVNICTPHLRDLTARPVKHFHGHVVEQEALDSIQKL